MRKQAKTWTWAAALAFLAVPALAGSAEAQWTDYITLTDLDDAEVGDYDDDGSYYVGRYGFQLGASPGGATYDFYCVDFANRVNYGETIEAHFTSLANLDGDSPTYLNDLDTYRQAAYLTQQFRDDNRSEWGGIHAAIWNITGTEYPEGGDADAAGAWIIEASNPDNYGSIDLADWAVVTPFLNSQGERYRQEFITYNVPEPASMLLLGSGLIGVAWMRRRKNDVEQDEELA